jgi:hypothetical protein
MPQETQTFIIQCEDESSAGAISTGLADDAGISSNLLTRHNLDGNAATWIVVVSSAISALPKILEALAKVIEAAKVRSISVDGHEIRNPTPSDVRAIRKRLSK